MTDSGTLPMWRGAALLDCRAMSKKKKEAGASAGKTPAEGHRLYGLIAAGDYRSARLEARRILDDAASPPEERTIAEDVLRRTDVEPGARLVGIVALVVIAVVAALIYLR